METSRSNRLALALALALVPGIAAAQVIAMQKMPPVAKGVAAFPEIAAPKDEAQRAINAAVTLLDRKVLAVKKSCSSADGFWQRTVNVTMAGPRWL